MKMQSAWCCIVCLSLAVLAPAAEKPAADTPATSFKAGDRVKAKFGRDWTPATVVKILSNGWITVSMQKTGQTVTPTLTPDKVIPADAPEPRPPASSRIESPDMRSWTLADGTRLSHARVHRWKPGMKKVLLQKENGICTSVELTKLSEADRAYLATLPEVRAD